MFFQTTVIMASVIGAAIGAPFSYAGGGESNGGNGGAFCRLGAEAPKPCDLFFAEREWQLPYNESQKVVFDNLPEQTRAELLKMNELLRNRSLGAIDVLGRLKDNVLIYDTSVFLGDEVQGIDAHGDGRQVGYAYWFNRIDPADKAKIETVRVMELDLAFLKTVPARYQALAILHEYLHFGYNLDHAVISPLLKALDKLMAIHDEQQAGVRRMLTDDELVTSRDFQAYLVHLGMAPDDYARTIVHPFGGGVVSFDVPKNATLPSLDISNFVGIAASVKGLEPGAAYYWKGGNVGDEMTSIKMPTRSKNLQTYAIGGGVENVWSDGVSRTDWVLNASLAPRTKCMRFNGEGVCDAHAYWFPLEFKARIGDSDRIERFAVTLFTYKDSIEEDLSSFKGSSCSVHVGRVAYEGLRHELGTMVTASLAGLECEAAIRILKQGNLKLIGGLSGSGAPWGILGTSTWSTSKTHPTDSAKKMAGTSLSLRFTGSAGVQIFDTASLSVFGVYDGAGSRENDMNQAGLSRTTYGTRLRVNVGDHYYFDASLHKNRDEVSWLVGKEINNWDVRGVRESLTYYEKVFGITFGGRHDLMGPFKR